ncbi:MAG: methyltransferase [Bacteroidales bacterium]|nr:methyltransferase [Bacteroidales bacterium]
MSSVLPSKRKPFIFKQFTIFHDRCAMPLSTDSVLLGSWAPIETDHLILEVGSGCGIISLMMAQRNYTCRIDTVEIDPESFQQGLENFRNSKWADRIWTYCESFQSFSQKNSNLYDHIVCNPPFFHKQLRSPYHNRVISKHAVSLTFAELISESYKLLNEKGKLSVIIPYTEKNFFIQESTKNGLFCIKETSIRSAPEMSFFRSLLTFSKEPAALQKDVLTLYEKDKKTLSKAFKALTHPFYLNVNPPRAKE